MTKFQDGWYTELYRGFLVVVFEDRKTNLWNWSVREIAARERGFSSKDQAQKAARRHLNEFVDTHSETMVEAVRAFA